MTCIECGETIEFRWVPERNEVLRERQMCFTDSYWQDQLNDRSNAVVTEEYNHYRIEPEDRRGFRGFGGHPFRVTFFDGRVVETTNLWHQAEIPERWRDRLRANATVESNWSPSTSGGAAHNSDPADS